MAKKKTKKKLEKFVVSLVVRGMCSDETNVTPSIYFFNSYEEAMSFINGVDTIHRYIDEEYGISTSWEEVPNE